MERTRLKYFCDRCGVDHNHDDYCPKIEIVGDKIIERRPQEETEEKREPVQVWIARLRKEEREEQGFM